MKTREIYANSGEEVLGCLNWYTKEDLEPIFTQAQKAKRAWRETSLSERAAYLEQAAQRLSECQDELAYILSKEIDKNYDEAYAEVQRSIDLIIYTAEEGRRQEGQIMNGGSFSAKEQKKQALIQRRPLGLILAIAPFNYPVNLSASKIAPALMGGNVVILKTPTKGALAAKRLGDCFIEAGLAPGVIQVVTGSGCEIGDDLVQDSRIDGINFTGSSEVGKHIQSIAGLKPLIMELGGKDAAIVLADADLSLAAREIVQGAFSYAGQRCTAIKRVLVVPEVKEKLEEYLKLEVAHLTVGREEKVVPLISETAVSKVLQLVEEAQSFGAKLLTPCHVEGRQLSPVLVSEVTPAMRLAWEEPFGPVLPILEVKDIEEAIRLANASKYGLQASIFTQDFLSAQAIAAQLEVGTIHWNEKTQRGTDNFPFLGWKDSGLNVQGVRYAIEAMTHCQSFVYTQK